MLFWADTHTYKNCNKSVKFQPIPMKIFVYATSEPFRCPVILHDNKRIDII